MRGRGGRGPPALTTPTSTNRATSRKPYAVDCLPNPNFYNAILAEWSDLLMTASVCGPNCGIYTSVSGSAPNRIFNIEWRACLTQGTGCGGQVDFEVRLYEGQNRFDV